MPNNTNRVLTRKGARQLSQDEIEQTAGAGATLLSVIVTDTAGNPDQRLDHSCRNRLNREVQTAEARAAGRRFRPYAV